MDDEVMRMSDGATFSSRARPVTDAYTTLPPAAITVARMRMTVFGAKPATENGNLNGDDDTMPRRLEPCPVISIKYSTDVIAAPPVLVLTIST
jgi:hypothetical protein